ncbi:hypothetical protein [Pseudomonas virus PBPA162]|uniref:Uncharacterized protein n=2 Tax=Viruses TaxID=10239 RepID=A0A4Y5TNA7_9CAUD|nr:hypothetical protein PQC32_gp04 [Pseudomonas virus PBPA162]QDB70838.1 hypothetical protein [Pseudomonas virus PBPA162]
MYIVIDREDCVFLPIKHHSLQAVCNLTWLEASHAHHTHIMDLYDHNSLRGFTDMELFLLYKNTTGLERPPRMGDALRNILLHMAQAIPETEINIGKLIVQCDGVTEEQVLESSWRYDHTGYRAQVQESLFKLEPVRMAPLADEVAAAKARPVRQAAPKPVPAPTPAPAPQAAPTAAPGPIPAPWGRTPAMHTQGQVQAPVKNVQPTPQVTSQFKKPWEK